MWITVDVERVLRVDRGINVILCNPMLGSGGPQTLVLKLKGSGMANDQQQASVEHLQSRGRHYDIIIEAIATYDEYMLDDDYDAQRTLGKIIKKMRERVGMTDAPVSATTGDEIQRLRSALESIADWRNVNISGEYELGLRDIIRSIVDCAVAVLESASLSRPAPQAAPTRDGIAKVIQSHVMMRSRGGRSMEIFGFEEAADAILALSRPASSTCHGCGASFDPNCTVCGGLTYTRGGY